MSDEFILDARWLEPPEPMERALAALERARPGERIRLLIHREPFPLYELLALRGWHYRTERRDDDCYEVLIFRDGPA